MKAGFEEHQLKDATVQEIQLELMRRRRFNEFDGPRIVADLLAVQELWQGVFMDRLVHQFGDDRPTMGLIKLRDLPGNYWNVDSLFILCEDETKARELQRHIEQRDWKADDIELTTDPDRVGSMLGMFPTNQAILELWWD